MGSRGGHPSGKFPAVYHETEVVDDGEYAHALCRGSAHHRDGILPHKEMDRAFSIAMGVDIPFWPQLPKMNYYEGMYVQAAENFPGIVLEPENRRIHLSTERFYAELENTLMNFEEEEALT